MTFCLGKRSSMVRKFFSKLFDITVATLIILLAIPALPFLTLLELTKGKYFTLRHWHYLCIV
jgi:hypothetical protein